MNRFGLANLAWGLGAAIGASGVLNGSLRLGSPADLATSYGLVLLAKAAIVVALGVAGRRMRTALVRRVAQDARAFSLLAVLEVALMGAAIGIGVALSRTAPPVAVVIRDLRDWEAPSATRHTLDCLDWRRTGQRDNTCPAHHGCPGKYSPGKCRRCCYRSCQSHADWKMRGSNLSWACAYVIPMSMPRWRTCMLPHRRCRSRRRGRSCHDGG